MAEVAKSFAQDLGGPQEAPDRQGDRSSLIGAQAFTNALGAATDVVSLGAKAYATSAKNPSLDEDAQTVISGLADTRARIDLEGAAVADEKERLMGEMQAAQGQLNATDANLKALGPVTPENMATQDLLMGQQLYGRELVTGLQGEIERLTEKERQLGSDSVKYRTDVMTTRVKLRLKYPAMASYIDSVMGNLDGSIASLNTAEAIHAEQQKEAAKIEREISAGAAQAGVSRAEYLSYQSEKARLEMDKSSLARGSFEADQLAPRFEDTFQRNAAMTYTDGLSYIESALRGANPETRNVQGEDLTLLLKHRVDQLIDGSRNQRSAIYGQYAQNGRISDKMTQANNRLDQEAEAMRTRLYQRITDYQTAVRSGKRSPGIGDFGSDGKWITQTVAYWPELENIVHEEWVAKGDRRTFVHALWDANRAAMVDIQSDGMLNNFEAHLAKLESPAEVQYQRAIFNQFTRNPDRMFDITKAMVDTGLLSETDFNSARESWQRIHGGLPTPVAKVVDSKLLNSPETLKDEKSANMVYMTLLNAASDGDVVTAATSRVVPVIRQSPELSAKFASLLDEQFTMEGFSKGDVPVSETEFDQEARPVYNKKAGILTIPFSPASFLSPKGRKEDTVLERGVANAAYRLGREGDVAARFNSYANMAYVTLGEEKGKKLVTQWATRLGLIGRDSINGDKVTDLDEGKK